MKKRTIRYSHAVKLRQMSDRIAAAKEEQTIRILRRVKRSDELTEDQRNRVYRWERKNEHSI